MTTTDQDRRIEDRSIELGAAGVEISPVGPASTRAIVARYQDAAGEPLDVERIRVDGTTTDPSRWLRYARSWRQYAGQIATKAILAALAAAAIAAAPAAATTPPSKIVALEIGDEIVPCPGGGRVLSIRERDTGLRLVRQPRPPRYLRRVNELEEARRGWELDRRDLGDRGSARYFAHTRGAELANWTPAAIRVRVSCGAAR